MAEPEAGPENFSQPVGGATVGMSEEVRINGERDASIRVTEAVLHLGNRCARRNHGRGAATIFPAGWWRTRAAAPTQSRSSR